MSTTTPDQQLSLTEAFEAAQEAADGPPVVHDPEPLPPAAPAQRLVTDAVTAAIDAGLFDRRVFPPARPRRRLIPRTVGQAIGAGFLSRDWTDCSHEDIWMESGSCMACEPAWQTPTERESREELDLRRQPGDYE